VGYVFFDTEEEMRREYERTIQLMLMLPGLAGSLGAGAIPKMPRIDVGRIRLAAPRPGQPPAGGAAGSCAPTRVVDPHLDANLLIAAADRSNVNHAAAVAFLRANQSAGLSASQTALREFLARPAAPGTQTFVQLQRTYGIRLIRDIPQGQISQTAIRLQRAFTDGRRLRDADARIAAEAFLRGEKLGTADLAFYKRARDLGLNVEFIGSDPRALARAAAYIPNPVTIPSP
jgi:hypothetical protein